MSFLCHQSLRAGGPVLHIKYVLGIPLPRHGTRGPFPHGHTSQPTVQKLGFRLKQRHSSPANIAKKSALSSGSMIWGKSLPQLPLQLVTSIHKFSNSNSKAEYQAQIRSLKFYKLIQIPLYINRRNCSENNCVAMWGGLKKLVGKQN